jgi:hypothetical protein
MVAKIATQEIADDLDQRSVGKIRSGKAGGKARAESLTAADRKEIAHRAAEARWASSRQK